MTNKRILYITYDGISDPLGQSQILPYLEGLSKYGYRFTILSFEKKHRFREQESFLRSQMKATGINWIPLTFTSRPPLLSKFYDAFRMRRKAIRLHKKLKFDMIHCRSYIAADVGLTLKKKFGTRFFFDMRGFWADEKKDGGSWKMDHPVFKKVYTYYKQKERQYLQNADFVISLTYAAKKEILTWESYKKEVPLQVIPCCADMDHFSLTDTVQKAEARKTIGFTDSNLIVSYLGSIGTWYMLEEMLTLFQKIKRRYSTAKFLIVTHSPKQLITEKIRALSLDIGDFMIKQASRDEVPNLIKSSDLSISFIKPVYSKISSSPTKLGEVLSMGIPVIVNSGVGDVQGIIEDAQAGFVVHNFSSEELDKAVDAIPSLLQKSPALIREAVKDIYSLENGIQLYLNSYKQILG